MFFPKRTIFKELSTMTHTPPKFVADVRDAAEHRYQEFLTSCKSQTGQELGAMLVEIANELDIPIQSSTGGPAEQFLNNLLESESIPDAVRLIVASQRPRAVAVDASISEILAKKTTRLKALFFQAEVARRRRDYLQSLINSGGVEVHDELEHDLLQAEVAYEMAENAIEAASHGPQFAQIREEIAQIISLVVQMFGGKDGIKSMLELYLETIKDRAASAAQKRAGVFGLTIGEAQEQGAESDDDKKSYAFEAMDASGQEIKDVIEASSEQEAQATILSMGYFVTKISQQ
jgi:hypothetical protein